MMSPYNRPNPPYNSDSLPIEWEYADDEEFLSEDRASLDNLLQLCGDVFKEWNLKVNESKTEFTNFHIADSGEVDDKGEPLKDREEWRNSITLGSKLCTIADVKHRCNKGQHAFHEFKKVWLQGNRIRLSRRIQVLRLLGHTVDPATSGINVLRTVRQKGSI